MKAIQVLVLCSVIFAISGCGPAAGTSTGDTTPGDTTPQASEETSSSSGGSIVDFSLRDSNGKIVALSDFLGEKVILISFWATWCEPCKKEMVQLQELYNQHKDSDLVVISISMDEPETMGEVAPYVKSRGYNYPILLDPEGEATNQFNPRRAAPFSLIISKDRQIQWEHEGYVPGDEKKIEEALLKAIGKSAE